MEPERASTPRDTRMSRACRTCLFITAVVYTNLGTEALNLTLCTPPLLVCRTRLVRSKREQVCVGMVWGSHGNYRGAQTGQ